MFTMRNSKFKLLLCLCAFLSSWLLCGVEAKCEVLEFPGAEKHRFTAPEKQWLNFSFNVRDEACVTAKPFEIFIEKKNQPLCILEIANGTCSILEGNICRCSCRSLMFEFSKIIEGDNEKEWGWFVLHDRDVTDNCKVSFGLNSSQKPNDSSNCKNRLPSTHHMDTLTNSAEIPCMKIESTSSGENNVNRKEQDSPIVLRSSSENVTAVLGERKSVEFLVQTRASQITNCTLSKTPNDSIAGRISTASPVNHSCIVRLEMQKGKNQSLQSTGSKCLCSFLTENASHTSLSVYLFDSRMDDSGLWSVKVKNSFGSGEAEFTLIVTDNTYAVREPEKGSSSFPIIPILLTVVAGLVVVGMVSFMCWRRKSKAEFQEPDYRSTPIVNNSLVIRKLPSTPSISSVTSLSNQTQSKRLLSVSRDQTRNRQTEDQVQESKAPTNVACKVNCCNEPVILDTGIKMSCSAVDMKLVLYIKGCPVNPEIPPVSSPTSADPEYLNPCSPTYATMDTVEKRNLHGTYQNDMAGDRYMSMSPPRYCSMPKSMTENAGVGGAVLSDPQIWNCNYDINEGNGRTTILHLDCMNAFEKKVAEVTEYEKKCAEVSEYSVIG